MTSSSKTNPDDDLPPAFASMWRLCKLGYRFEPALMGSAFALALLAALPDALLALWFKVMADGVATHDASRIRFAAIALGVSAAGTWFLRTTSTRVQYFYPRTGSKDFIRRHLQIVERRPFQVYWHLVARILGLGGFDKGRSPQVVQALPAIPRKPEDALKNVAGM